MSNLQIPDQRTLWNNKHNSHEHAMFRWEPSQFGLEFEALLPDGSLIHEIGCGVGGDALHFAQQGHHVFAADLSDVVLDQNMELLDHTNLRFLQNDVSQGLPFRESSLDAVFANLALHYYDHETTSRIFEDIVRALGANGWFGFVCKTVEDDDFGQGAMLESNYYITNSGHIRHFFTPDFVHELTDGLFVTEKLEEGQNDMGSRTIHTISYIGRKIDGDD